MWIESTIAMRFLRHGRAQTLLILFGIAVGVSVIVFVTALIAGLQANIIDRTLGTQAHVRVEAPREVNRVAPVPPGTLQLVLEDPRPQALRPIDNWLEVRDVLDRLPGVAAVSPVVSGPAFGRRGSAAESVALVGVDMPRYLRVIPLDEHVVEGRLEVGSGNAVVGSKLAEDLGLRLGGKLRLDAGEGREAIVNVAGIFELGVRELDARYVYLDLKQAQSLLALPGGVTVIDMTVQDLFGADRIATRVAGLTGLKAESWMDTNAQLMNALSSQSMSTRMISVFVALSVALGIASVLAVSVAQRTREIGILRAMGTRRRQMLLVFLVQGAVLGLAGALLGALAGWGLVWAFNNLGPGLFEIPMPPALVPAAMALATLSGIGAALVPASRASRLDPVEAIRG
ncbi:MULTISPECIES: FtsX-like permease family protein [unclassified Luteimonas]|uniref:ABC transporter permease n=1 Tax=unclassified Luteimonas TaxID=2629088 RepID=UPI0018F0A336|nr:FtsX-like permease family protein [Luteimonas sp. MC1750]MBJ6978477.1 ABC transporter permease [Luteimonas sp. MC1895]MBJ6983374.1 ABC transporter permease [Luteimonas sp. MC1750]QQO06230.1 ABC transporter permease [Luteimonas sp. MC1750]